MFAWLDKVNRLIRSADIDVRSRRASRNVLTIETDREGYTRLHQTGINIHSFALDDGDDETVTVRIKR